MTKEQSRDKGPYTISLIKFTSGICTEKCSLLLLYSHVCKAFNFDTKARKNQFDLIWASATILSIALTSVDSSK